MAYKTVSGTRIAEIQLDESVYTINFGSSYNYYTVRNDSDGTIYVSTTDKNCKPNNDGVVSIPSGGAYVHYNGFGGSPEIYISGTGGAVIIGQDDGICPFKSASKGGDSYNVDLNTLLVFRGVVSPSTTVNLNDLTNPGYYLLNSNNSSSFINSPTTYVWGLLIVISISGNIFQFFFGNNDRSFFYRSKWFNSSFTSWRQI